MAGTVHRVEAGKVAVHFDDGQVAEIPSDYVASGHLDHRYALTGHRSQGGTFEHVHVLVPAAGQLAEWGYVALSRHRGPVHICLCADPVRDAHIPEPSHPSEPLERLAQAPQVPAARGFVHPSQEPTRRNEMAPRGAEPDAAGDRQFDEDAWWGRYRSHLERRAVSDAGTGSLGPGPASVRHLTTEEIRNERAFLERALAPGVQAATGDLVRRRQAGIGERQQGAPRPLEPPPITLDLDSVSPEWFVERLHQCDDVLREPARYGIDRIENLTTRALAAEARWLRLAVEPGVRASAEHTAVLQRLHAARSQAQTDLNEANPFRKHRLKAEVDRLTTRIRTAAAAAPPHRPLPDPPPSLKAAGISWRIIEERGRQVEAALRDRITAARIQLTQDGPRPSAAELAAVREAVQALSESPSSSDSTAPVATQRREGQLPPAFDMGPLR